MGAGALRRRGEDKDADADGVRWELVWVGIGLGVVGVVGYLWWLVAGGGLVRDGHWVGLDFHVYYQAAQVLRRGGDIYGAGISPPYVYPPVLALLVAPLTALPVDGATIVWKVIQHMCLLLAGGLLVGMVPAVNRVFAGGLLLLGLLTVPVRDEILYGESNSLVFALVVGAVWLIWRAEGGERGGVAGRSLLPGRWDEVAIGAGLLLGLATSIKVLPVLLVAYLWWRGPRVSAAVATGSFLGIQLLMLLVTPSTVDYWLREFPGLFGQAFSGPDNQSFNAIIARATLGSGEPGRPNMHLFDGAAVRPVLTWVANLGMVGASAWVLWGGRGRESRVSLLLGVGLVMQMTHLVSGSTWVHHLIDLSLVVVALVWIGVTRAWLGVVPVGLGYVVLLAHPADWVRWANVVAPGVAPVALAAGSLPMLVVLAGWVWLAAVYRRRVM